MNDLLYWAAGIATGALVVVSIWLVVEALRFSKRTQQLKGERINKG